MSSVEVDVNGSGGFDGGGGSFDEGCGGFDGGGDGGGGGGYGGGSADAGPPPSAAAVDSGIAFAATKAELRAEHAAAAAAAAARGDIADAAHPPSPPESPSKSRPSSRSSSPPPRIYHASLRHPDCPRRRAGASGALRTWLKEARQRSWEKAWETLRFFAQLQLTGDRKFNASLRKATAQAAGHRKVELLHAAGLGGDPRRTPLVLLKISQLHYNLKCSPKKDIDRIEHIRIDYLKENI
jgi:hypothetical protein